MIRAILLAGLAGLTACAADPPPSHVCSVTPTDVVECREAP
ncbi:MAG TPA: hypothetical protein PKD10_17840 [Paracoccaceae bacterium]|nr:hypothetical protein [Paracoccaceae bacterium]HMO73422.1 hypothetical protein [Paracoccaceae bacterium]